MGKEIKDSRLIEQIGQFFIDEIEKNATSGKDINGNTMPKYSKSYKASDDFKLFGKSSKVDMTLKGDMISDLDIIEQKDDKITLGFNSELSTLKAANHNKGVTVPKRQFFGVTQLMIDEAKKMFADELKEEKQSETKTLAEIFASSTRDKTAIAQLVDSIWGSEFDVEGL